ncbi:psoralen synthase-like isoform X2 [Apium graveolens]|uniref:psoralen synthase-like isoform X2 n=1 Tax=Apium graveolens TaxID=4045 RepID=UPI003D79FACD
MPEQYPLYLYPFSLFLVTILLYNWLTHRKLVLEKLPPSPPKFPIIGNLHQIGPDPHISLRALAQRYGPLKLLKFGRVPVLVVSSADAAREILKTHDLVFSDRPSSSVSNRIFYNGRDVAFARYSEYWRQVKSTFCRVALGRKYENGHKGNSFKSLLGDIMNMLGYSRSIGDFFPFFGWVDWLNGLNGKVEKLAKEMDTFLEGVLRDRLSTSALNIDSANKDFVSILIDIQNTDAASSIDKECIKAVILDMFVAGTETTATSLEWTIAALIKSPDVMFKLQNEVREIGNGKSMILEGDLVKMNYLKAVMKESMRLYFTAPLLVPRQARQDVKVMGYDIRSGTQVLINAWAIARDPSLWDKPEEFRPERFLNSPIDYKGLHYEYVPFGAGRRGCPGIQFAMAVNELAVANVVHKFDFKLPDGKRLEDLDMTAVTGLTLRRESPLLVVATPHI